MTTALLLAAACTDDAPSSSPSASPSSSSPSSGPDAVRLTDVAAGSPLTPGRYAFDALGAEADVPLALIDVPAGYVAGGDGAEIASEDDAAFRQFDAWTVASVVTQPCGDEVEWVDPGPTPEDLAEALVALPVWESTPPTPITLDGHDGVSLELNVPADLPAECEDGPHGWRDDAGGTQGIGPGKTQRLWIVDVDGVRLMLLAGYFPGPEGPTPEQVDEMTRMAESATFVAAQA